MKTKIILASSITLMALSFSACSDSSDSESSAPIIDGGTTSINLDLNQTVCDIPVTGDSKWIVTPMEKYNWCQVLDFTGTGKGTASVSIDDNLGSSARTAVFKVANADDLSKYSTYAIKQSNLASIGTNSNDDAARLASRGLGHTLSYADSTLHVSGNTVFSLTKIQRAITNGKLSLDDDYYQSTKNNNLTLNFYNYDSIEAKKDTLGVRLAIDVNFYKFKINVTGKYHSQEQSDKNHLYYSFGFNYPYEVSTIDALSLAACAANDPNAAHYFYSAGFLEVYERVLSCIDSKDSIELRNALEDIYVNYGALIITGVQLGGSYMMNLTLDRQAISDTTTINGTANLKMAFTGIGIEGNVAAGYLKRGFELLNNCKYEVETKGGDLNKALDIATYLQSEDVSNMVKSSKVSDSKLLELEKLFAASIDKNNAPAISYDVRPIWLAFPLKYRSAVKQYMQKRIAADSHFPASLSSKLN